MSVADARTLFDQIPSAVEMPAAPEPTRMAVRSAGFSRRRVLGAATGMAVATGLSVFDLFPWSRPRAAVAAAYEEWSTSCRGYFNSSSICVPSSAYYGGDNCSGNWHRSGSSSGDCWNAYYTHDPSSCDGKNAWRWTVGTKRKCSDGWYQYYSCFGDVSRFSICRTAI